MPRVLILGGTGEARTLAAELVANPGRDRPDIEVVSSLAGRVRRPQLPDGAVRTGGFGGADALATWLRQNMIDLVVDATHPFAATISAHADQACRSAGVDLLCLTRPPWIPTCRDNWIEVPSGSAANAALADQGLTGRGTVFLTVGRGGLAPFTGLTRRVLIRTIDPPHGPLPADSEVILDRGPFDVRSEKALMLSHGVAVVVTKNSGGDMTRAKVEAAAELGIAVVMIERPAPTAGRPVVTEAHRAALVVRSWF